MSGLDFWIGDWDAAWDGGIGRNVASRALDDRGIVERFEALGAHALTGMSISVQEEGSGIWRQTWADSLGSYWTFVGGPQDDGSFVFAARGPVDADQVFKRMVFFDIDDAAFNWCWGFSLFAVTRAQR